MSVFVCLSSSCRYRCVSVGVPSEARGIRFPIGTGVTSGCELPNVGTKN